MVFSNLPLTPAITSLPSSLFDGASLLIVFVALICNRSPSLPVLKPSPPLSKGRTPVVDCA